MTLNGIYEIDLERGRFHTQHQPKIKIQNFFFAYALSPFIKSDELFISHNIHLFIHQRKA